MLQDSYIIAPLGLVHDQGGYNAKSNDGTWYFVVDPTSSVYLACLGRNEYQKWKLIATGHSRAGKYDICGASSEWQNLTWGSHEGPIKLETFSQGCAISPAGR